MYRFGVTFIGHQNIAFDLDNIRMQIDRVRHDRSSQNTNGNVERFGIRKGWFESGKYRSCIRFCDKELNHKNKCNDPNHGHYGKFDVTVSSLEGRADTDQCETRCRGQDGSGPQRKITNKLKTNSSTNHLRHIGGYHG